MDASTIYAIGTLATWVGWFFAIRLVILAVRLWGNAPGLDRDRTIASISVAALFGALGLGASFLMRLDPGRELEPGFRLPIVWLSLPFSAWVAVACFVGVIVRFVQVQSMVDPDERKRLTVAIGAWAAVGLAAFAWYRTKSFGLDILRGAIVLQPAQAGAVAMLGIAAIGLMAIASRSVKAHGRVKAFATHLALIIGSIVFGLPFAWMMITSFKEDRDMANANGLVWIPKVTVTVPYMDEKTPTIEAEFQGQTVEGSIVKTNPDGSAIIDISRPSVMRGMTFTAQPPLKRIPRQIQVVYAEHQGQKIEGKVIEDLEDGSKRVQIMEPASLLDQIVVFPPGTTDPKRVVGLRVQNYSEALEFLPVETVKGLVYVRNTLVIVVMNVLGTLLSSAIVAYAFARLRFPGKKQLFVLLLSTMMLPAAVTLLPTFLIFRQLGWVDTLLPLWVPAFFGSAFNIFMLRQFFATIPGELEDAAKIDGCSFWKTFWTVMLPQIKPALAVVAIWTFMGSWNNFMGPLVYITSPEKMPVSYALQLFQSDRGTEAGLLMAASTMSILPVLALFFFAQKYFIEGVALSGLGGR